MVGGDGGLEFEGLDMEMFGAGIGLDHSVVLEAVLLELLADHGEEAVVVPGIVSHEFVRNILIIRSLGNKT